MNAEGPCLVGGGADHAPALESADDDRLAAQLGPVALLHGRIERVHVHVDDGARPASIRGHGQWQGASVGVDGGRRLGVMPQPVDLGFEDAEELTAKAGTMGLNSLQWGHDNGVVEERGFPWDDEIRLGRFNGATPRWAWKASSWLKNQKNNNKTASAVLLSFSLNKSL